MKFYRLSISVRELIEFVFLTGDLSMGITCSNRMLQGAEGHRCIQNARKENWQNEVYVKYEMPAENTLDFLRSQYQPSSTPYVSFAKNSSASPLNLPLKKEAESDEFISIPTGSILLHGRIDGVLATDDITVIEEIKTFVGKVDFKTHRLSDHIDADFWFEHSQMLSEYQNQFTGLSFLHWAQALIYAFIYLKNHGLKEVICRVNYAELRISKSRSSGLVTQNSKLFEVLCSADFLEMFFHYTFEKWLQHHSEYSQQKQIARASLLTLHFPFSFRAEQRKMAVAVYRNITDGTNLFSRAPTGTGKTLASIFPALKTMGEEKIDKIFYLTAKTVGKTVAESSIQLLQNKGANIRYSVMTAKEKTCFKDFALCDPEFCEFAHDYYPKQRQALTAAMDYKVWNFERITDIARQFELCPFEFSLYLSQYAEIVICDYNYVFDPIAYFRRHFDNIEYKYAFLIDEAHNLTERAREMYSQEISNEILSEWIIDFPDKKLKIYKKMIELRNVLKNQTPLDKVFFILKDYPENILKLIEEIIGLIEKQMEKKNKAFNRYYMIKIYFQLVFLLDAIRSMTEEHIIYYMRGCTNPIYSTSPKEDDTCILKIFCLNPRKLFAEYLKFAKSSIFFSATLHPFDYFCEILAEKEKDNRLSLVSPFDKENFGLYIYTGINTLYKNRENSYQPLADLIYDTCQLKEGNYLIYFPSFSFLKNVAQLIRLENTLVEQETSPNASSNHFSNIVCQKPNMSEKEKAEFLALFDDTSTGKIGFAVLGGIFGEGIDLIGSKLIGCMIVSVGLPFLGGEKDLIKDYYDAENHQGFEYAYRFPGFNKVMQAAGRVIRSETDIGFVILIDPRYAKPDYKELYPSDWQHYKVFNNKELLTDEINRFWMR